MAPWEGFPSLKVGPEFIPPKKELNKEVAARDPPPTPLLAWGFLEPLHTKLTFRSQQWRWMVQMISLSQKWCFLRWTSRNHFQGCKTIDRWSSITNQRILSWYLPNATVQREAFGRLLRAVPAKDCWLGFRVVEPKIRSFKKGRQASGCGPCNYFLEPKILGGLMDWISQWRPTFKLLGITYIYL